MVAAFLPQFLTEFSGPRHAVRGWMACWLFLLMGMGVLPAAEVTATLNPPSVPAGQGANLTIKIINGNVTGVSPPEVPGLIVRGPGNGVERRFEEGVWNTTISLMYQVGSMAAGEYDIPPFTLTVDGAPVQTQAFKLTVTPSAAQMPAGLPPGTGGAPRSGSAAPGAAEDSFGFLTVDFASKDRKHAWVGEIAPVRIRAWLPDDVRVSLNTPLTPTGSSFTLHNLSDQPQQDNEILNGKRYTTVTWIGSLSFTKAGTYPPDLSMRITVQVPDPNGRRRTTGDPFFDQMLGRPMIQKVVTVSSRTDKSAELEIRALPDAGKPADFEGAVGRFNFGRVQIPPAWNTGEPQQVACEVEGEGNFTLLAQPQLRSAKEWKSYAGQSKFAARDAASFSGVTTFRFNQVPRQAGPQEVKLAFSYFNPDTASYQTVESPPQAVQVAGNDLPAEPEVTVKAPEPTAPPPAPTLAPQRTSEGFTRNLTPLAWRSWFRIYVIFLGLLLAGGVLSRILWKRFSDPRRLALAEQQRALQQAMSDANTYAARGDVPGFFAAARRALQHRLAPLWQRPAPSITLTDVTRRMPADSPILSIFQEADLQEFSPVPTLRPEELPAWRSRLEQALTLSL